MPLPKELHRKYLRGSRVIEQRYICFKLKISNSVLIFYKNILDMSLRYRIL
nr:unnamed protein product [Callosobruchus analis]